MIVRAVVLTLGLGFAWLVGVANREESRPGFFGLAQWLVLFGLAVLGGSMVLDGELVGLAVLTVVAGLTFPWAVARTWLIPRGHWRSAWFLVRSSAWTWHDDNRGGALVAAAWAAVRAGGPPAALAFVERRCERSDCGAAHLLATGLVAAARGDLEAARRWIGSLCEFTGKASPQMARRLALQWIAADAATRGAWSQLAQLDADRDVDAATAALIAVARRFVGAAPIPTDAELETAWRSVPQRAQFRALLDRALQHQASPAAPNSVVRATPVVDRDPHRAALVAHAHLLSHPRPDRVELVAVAQAWDRALADQAFTHRTQRRALELATRGDPIESLRARLDADLVEVARTARMVLGEDSAVARGTLGRVRRTLGQRLLDELEVVADALKTRVRTRRALAIHEEWREYLTLRGTYQSAVAMTGPVLQRLAFPCVNESICALAVWLWNDRKNRVHAHQMFRWLLSEAEKCEDAEAIALHRRNVECGR